MSSLPSPVGRSVLAFRWLWQCLDSRAVSCWIGRRISGFVCLLFWSFLLLVDYIGSHRTGFGDKQRTQHRQEGLHQDKSRVWNDQTATSCRKISQWKQIKREDSSSKVRLSQKRDNTYGCVVFHGVFQVQIHTHHPACAIFMVHSEYLFMDPHVEEFFLSDLVLVKKKKLKKTTKSVNK